MKLPKIDFSDKKTKIISLCILAILAVIIIVMPDLSLIGEKDKGIDNKDKLPEQQEEGQTEEVVDYSKYKELYETNHAINSEYVGIIEFESGIINLPFVQAADNEKYLHLEWTTQKTNNTGTVFMDCYNNIETDQNIILYGHNIKAASDPTKSLKFTPLHLLEVQENFQANQYIRLYLSDRIEIYQVCCVYRVDVKRVDGAQYLAEGEPEYYLANFTETYFKTFKKKILARQYYDTGVDFSYSDRFLTLQTCIESKLDKFVVMAKLVKTIKY